MSVALMLGSFAAGSFLLGGIAVAVIGLVVFRGPQLWARIRNKSAESGKENLEEPFAGRAQPQHEYAPPLPPIEGPLDESGQLVEDMLAQGRYCLLLRPQIAANLSDAQRLRAETALDAHMAIVPEGNVMLHSWLNENKKPDKDANKERIVKVDSIYLDRYLITNRQYQQFVDHGGYEQMQLWEPAIWPAVLDFVDQTGHSGPRFWREGKYPTEIADHPVVGVSWYEASAYARWAGKRLPSDPEWVKAGCWPVVTQGTKPMQRKFPWGDTMDRSLANLWGSGPGRTVSIYECSDGVSVGGVYQLIGNVWEWTTSQFGAWDTTGRRLELPTPMKSLRGGAFDTYFDVQANCQFQSGDSPLARKHNIGFRCAVALCDVATNNQHSEQDDEFAHDRQVPEEELV